MAELVPGSVVAGCRVEAVVGRGGMGVVYRATQLSLERMVALKAIAPELADDPTFRERFKRESRIAASIEHPNVIPVYEAGEGEGVLYLIMRYVEGTDLRALIDAEGRLSPERGTRIVAQVAAALAAAHRRDLIHRDVKPANVLIDASGERDHAYLTDFGIARNAAATSALTRTGSVIGTLDYLAPERIEDQRGDGRSDVYALGCVLFEALTGTLPYARDNDAAKMFAHLTAPVPSARALTPGVPEELDSLAMRAMAKDPAERFPTAGEMAQALTDTLPQRPVRPDAKPRRRRPPRPRRRRGGHWSRARRRQPATPEPAATEPAAPEPAATEPAATEPAATEPAAPEPAATEPAAHQARRAPPPPPAGTVAAPTGGASPTAPTRRRGSCWPSPAPRSRPPWSWSCCCCPGEGHRTRATGRTGSGRSPSARPRPYRSTPAPTGWPPAPAPSGWPTSATAGSSRSRRPRRPRGSPSPSGQTPTASPWGSGPCG